MADYDIMSFMEYYTDRDTAVDPVSGLRIPTKQWQNFYQLPQTLSIDPDVGGEYVYLPFDVSGFGLTQAASVNDLNVSIGGRQGIVDTTEEAMSTDNLIIASLYIQDVGFDSFNGASAQLINRFIGSIVGASLTDETVQWTVNPAINKLKSQVPTRKITADMLLRQIGS